MNMTLYILTENSQKVRPILNAICQHVNINDFFILDPKHDNVDKSYHYLLQVGPNKIIEQPKAFKAWHIPVIPDKEMDKEMKERVIEYFKKVKIAIDNMKEKSHKYTPGDMPPLKELSEFLNERQGQVIQVRLKDQRSVGIYPDNNKLMGEYDVEYHASTVVNMSKIMEIFDATELVVREV
jgi:hypothetical protein